MRTCCIIMPTWSFLSAEFLVLPFTLRNPAAVHILAREYTLPKAASASQINICLVLALQPPIPFLITNCSFLVSLIRKCATCLRKLLWSICFCQHRWPFKGGKTIWSRIFFLPFNLSYTLVLRYFPKIQILIMTWICSTPLMASH